MEDDEYVRIQKIRDPVVTRMYSPNRTAWK